MAHEMGDESTIGAGEPDAERDASTASASPPEATADSTLIWKPGAAHGVGHPGERPGDFIGPYKLLSMLGEGGFGVVWLAERREPHVQRVALKIIKPGMDSRAVIARFEQERQALAVMDHPNVAKVYDAGATPLGRPYFVMEAVQGEAITTYCDRHTLTIKQRLELFIPVCEAVQHAHHKGIIHRDIKPSNILVTIKDGNAIPKVIDFGVAKAISHTFTEKTIFTEQGQIIGTPEYMSPEQAEMGALDVDTRTDVYSLGVVLNEMLAGALPFDSEYLRSKAYDEIRRIIREDAPPRPSTRLTSGGDKAITIARQRQMQTDALNKQLQSELEWIPLKAMRKDRTERYATAKDLADDICHYLTGQPLDAGPEAAAYKLKKFLRRNKGPAAALSAIFLALSGGMIATLLALAEANTQRANAHRQMQWKLAALAENNTTIERMGGLLQSQGKLEQASVYLEMALLYKRRVLGDEHPDTLDWITNLGSLSESMGKLDQAWSYWFEALEKRRRVLGDAHPDTLDSINKLGGLLIRIDSPDEAVGLMVPAESATRQTFTSDDPHRLASFLMNLGNGRAGLGEFAQAEGNLLEAHEIFVQTRGLMHNDSRDCTQSLIHLYQAWHTAEPGKGYDLKAAEWRAKLAELQAATQPATQSATQPAITQPH